MFPHPRYLEFWPVLDEAIVAMGFSEAAARAALAATNNDTQAAVGALLGA